MHSDVKLAIRLQELDARVAELTAEIAALPRHIAAIEKKLDSHQRKLEADRAALAANQRDRRKLEGDIQTQEQKISKWKDQMLQAKTNDQYRAFQHEIQFCEDEIRKAEDKILDLMAESEPLEKNVRAAEEALKIEKADVEREKTAARERTERDKRQLTELRVERAAVSREMNPSALSTYERIRKLRRGVAVAEVIDGRCSQCHIVLRLQFLQDLKKGDQIMQCESCGRLLYHNPPQSFEDLAGEPAPAGDQTRT
jgi:predicted  nucleic acid-binding Zn-ribbon protein